MYFATLMRVSSWTTTTLRDLRSSIADEAREKARGGSRARASVRAGGVHIFSISEVAAKSYARAWKGKLTATL